MQTTTLSGQTVGPVEQLIALHVYDDLSGAQNALVVKPLHATARHEA